jgi:hypothetical protein
MSQGALEAGMLPKIPPELELAERPLTPPNGAQKARMHGNGRPIDENAEKSRVHGGQLDASAAPLTR